MTRAVSVGICALVLTLASVASAEDERITVSEVESTLRTGKAALQAGDSAGALRAFQSLIKVAPDDPDVLTDFARAQVMAGHTEQALDTLERVTRLGFGLNLGTDPAFTPLAASPRFSDLLRRVEPLKRPVAQTQVAFTIAERDLIPEGMAYDAKTGTFYVSSIYKRKIVAIDHSGKPREFIAPAQDGIWKVLGMKVNPKDRTLIVCSMANNTHVAGGLPVADVGRSGVWIFDLRTGHIRGKFLTPPGSGRHLFNDLVVTRRGDIYLTDSEEGALYKLTSNAGLQRITEAARFLYPNGIALSADDRLLYIADATGIYGYDLATGNVSPVIHPSNVTLTGIDGLYFHRGDLIAIQNGVTPMRLVRFRLGRDRKSVDKADILEWLNPQIILPTTGANAGDVFYFIADAQLGAFNADGSIWPMEKLKPVVILKTRLRGNRTQ